MRRPVRLGHVQRRQVPARFPDIARGAATGSALGRVRQLDKAKILVQLPIPIGRKLGQAAEALFAFAQHLLGLLALYELADLAADHVHRPQQSLLRLAHFTAME